LSDSFIVHLGVAGIVADNRWRRASDDDIEASIQMHEFQQRLEAPDFRDQHIQNDAIGTLPVRYLGDGFFAAADRIHVTTVRLENSQQILSNARFVIHNEDFVFWFHRLCAWSSYTHTIANLNLPGLGCSYL
jgi:hypothetical protein